MPNAPAIGVVVVHYGADELTLRCLRSLSADSVSQPVEIVLVENGPGDAFVRRVRDDLPQVRVLVPGANLGFAGGCNLGISALAHVELIALVNSDVEVPAGWLRPLVEAIAQDDRIGAACPKICFDGRFHTLELSVEDAWRPGWGDRRDLAWRLDAVRLDDGRDVRGASQLVEGFWEPARHGVWAGRRAVLRVPAAPGVRSVELLVRTPPGRAVLLRERSTGVEVELPAGGGWCALGLQGDPCSVINNAGNAWRRDGYGIDVGYQEVDVGQHDEPGAVDAWCGGAVLLRRTYLDETGGFDDRLFLYYEDLELALRGSSLGWTYRYEPRSVVVHRHAASTSAHPGRTARLKERNRLLVLARHGPPAVLAQELARFVWVTVSYLRRDVLSPVVRGEAPWGGIVRQRMGALAGALALLPAMLLSRRGDRRRSNRESVRWPDC